MQCVLTIAGFDPSSGAGISADLLTFQAHGLFGTSAITSLTVQSTRGVFASHAVAPGLLRSTLECLQADLPADGIKLGMLANAENVEVVSDFLQSLRSQGSRIPVVLDPVLRSSSGRALLSPEGINLLRTRLLSFVDWITPNVDELAVLLHQEHILPSNLPAAARLLQQGREDLHVVVTGGHLQRPDDLFVSPAGEAIWVEGRRIATTSTHGTGCAFSSSLTSQLVLGESPPSAVSLAKVYVAEALLSAPGLGSGRGPLDHLWPLRRSPGKR